MVVATLARKEVNGDRIRKGGSFRYSCDGALPSFHVIWAILIAAAIGGWPARVWALLISLSCVTTGMHTVADVVAGAVAALFVVRAPEAWERLRAAGERIANSAATA